MPLRLVVGFGVWWHMISVDKIGWRNSAWIAWKIVPTYSHRRPGSTLNLGRVATITGRMALASCDQCGPTNATIAVLFAYLTNAGSGADEAGPYAAWNSSSRLFWKRISVLPSKAQSHIS
jgi:hypothetical protein